MKKLSKKEEGRGHFRSWRLVLFISLIIFIISCEKHPFDHRNKYLGKWDFTTQWIKVNIDSLGQNDGGYEYYLGEIKYGDTENELIIEFMNGKEARIEIDKHGKITNYGSPYGSGYLEVDQLNLYLRFGGLGGYTSYSIAGSR